MKRVILGFALLPFLGGLTLAGQVTTHKQLLNDKQIDTVIAGKDRLSKFEISGFHFGAGNPVTIPGPKK
jgi:hypothetical protein